MAREQSFASEKAIYRHLLKDPRKELRTEVKRHQPTDYENPVEESRIGAYRPLERRMCVTAEMDIIKGCFGEGKEPASFLEAGPRKFLYFDRRDVRVGIVTPGGVAPGLNTVIHSIVNMHMHPGLYGSHNEVCGFPGGFQELATKDPKPIPLNPNRTKDWIHKGGTELGTGGRELQDISKMAHSLRDLGVNILYVVGGDGSLTAAHEIAKKIDEEDIRVGDKKIVVAGIPKTMDNDILWVWHSFGFDTAVEEATKAVNAIHEDTRSTERICLMQLFGRDAGFVAAHASLASGLVDVVLVPEEEFKTDPLLHYIESIVTREYHALIVVAEGAGPTEYTEDYIHEKLRERGYDPADPSYRSHPEVSAALSDGKLTFLKDKLTKWAREFRDGRHRVFVSRPRHLIRAVPPFSVDQIYCRRLADMAVHNALAGFTDFMISQWLTEYVLVPLELVVENQINPSGPRPTKKIPPGGIFWTTVTSSTGQPSFDC